MTKKDYASDPLSLLDVVKGILYNTYGFLYHDLDDLYSVATIALLEANVDESFTDGQIRRYLIIKALGAVKDELRKNSGLCGARGGLLRIRDGTYYPEFFSYVDSCFSTDGLEGRIINRDLLVRIFNEADLTPKEFKVLKEYYLSDKNQSEIGDECKQYKEWPLHNDLRYKDRSYISEAAISVVRNRALNKLRAAAKRLGIDDYISSISEGEVTFKWDTFEWDKL